MNVQGVINHITSWLSNYADMSGVDGFVVGVSGGIDSAVTSALACKTGYEVLCLEMPIYQSEGQVSRACQHIDNLKSSYARVKSHCVDLTPVFDSMLAALPAVEDEGQRHLALANTRARLRMTTLYYFAGLSNYLVVGTGNKVEDFGVGFYTKYGDGGVDVSPIADLMKSEVYQLGQVLDVNAAIMNAPPTDGLWGDDRNDEDQLGASYPELEWAMKYQSGSSVHKLSEREQSVLEIYNRLHKANQHKMQPIPVCEIPEALKSTTINSNITSRRK